MSAMSRKEFLKAAGAGLGLGAAARAASSSGESATASGELILTDAVVLTVDGERRCHRSGYVWIRGPRIHAVGPTSELRAPARATVRRLSGHVVLPGLVDCHTHLSNALLRGVYDEMPLAVWFSKGMWPVLQALDAEAGAAGAALSLLELMGAGVTTVAAGDFGTPNPSLLDGVLETASRSGIRAVVSRITVDGEDSSPSQAIPPAFREKPERAVAEVKRLRRRWSSDRITVVPEALGVLRCTPAMVEAMHDLAVSEGAGFFMHIASSPDEDAESRKRFGHGSVTELARLGGLGPRTLLAHAIWLSDAEIALLAENGTGVSHNPVSNAYYASGIGRLEELVEKGVRVGLGTDGASTNNGQNLWETAKMALLFQKQRLGAAGFGSAELALELLTIGGARALHLEHEIGSLEAGKRADLIVLDAERPCFTPAQTLVSNLVYAPDPSAVRSVFVDGEEVVRDGAHLRLSREEALARGREAATRVLERAGLDSYLAGRGRWRWA
jgi:5-methylthioadenosine/S-adenosylhomocysteine deaminase